jgi:hypothetical protein
VTHAYRVSSDAAFRDLEGESVILDLASGTYYGLNEVGTRIWVLLDEGRDEEGIAVALTAEYEVALEDARHHVRALLADLLARGLILEQPGTSG